MIISIQIRLHKYLPPKKITDQEVQTEIATESLVSWISYFTALVTVTTTTAALTTSNNILSPINFIPSKVTSQSNNNMTLM